MPQHRLEQGSRATVVEEEAIAGDGLGKTDPPQRRRPPFATLGGAVGEAVGKRLAHVVKQQVGIGMNRPAGDAGDQGRNVAGPTAGGGEQRLAVARLGIVEVAPGGNREAAQIGHQERDVGLADLVGGGAGGNGARLSRRATAERALSRGEAHVLGRRFDHLVAQAGLGRLPAEAPEAAVGEPRQTPRDAVAVAVEGIGEAGEGGLGHRLEQAHADQRRRQARRQKGLAQGHGGTVNGIVGRAQAVGGAVGEASRPLFIGEANAPLARHPGHRLILELGAKQRVRPHRRQAEADDQGARRTRHHAGLGRPAAAVFHMAAGAGAAVEQRAETAVLGRAGGHRAPLDAKQPPPRREGRQLGLVEARHRRRIGLARGDEHGAGGTARKRLASPRAGRPKQGDDRKMSRPGSHGPSLPQTAEV